MNSLSILINFTPVLEHANVHERFSIFGNLAHQEQAQGRALLCRSDADKYVKVWKHMRIIARPGS
jgi:hypothetical protein